MSKRANNQRSVTPAGKDAGNPEGPGTGLKWLHPDNCNKAMCKTCIFREDGNQLQLEPGRLNEIKGYLIASSSHICHTTNKTCFGALSFQAMIFFRIGMIPEESVQSFLATAKEHICRPNT